MLQWLFLVTIVLTLAVLAWRLIVRKNVDIIARHVLTHRKESCEATKHVFFCVADHFEPFWRGVDLGVARQRVERWLVGYPAAVDKFRDNSGRPPQHSFFYPAEEYEPGCLESLAVLERRGYGCVEVHLHHDRDTSENFRHKILTFTRTLNAQHGLLNVRPASGEIEYGFIHGMFALDDSGPCGRWCGVKDEIRILKETGCYADFTFPSAPDPTQPPIVNRIYYATDDPKRAKSHHKGVDAEFGKKPSGDLLLVTGPVGINWRQRRKFILPAIENSALSANGPPTADRVDFWVRTAISVRGWPSWIFVKIHTHGAQESISSMLFDGGLKTLYSQLTQRYNDGDRFVLHFVRPREIYHCVKALEAGDRDWIRAIENFEYAPRDEKSPTHGGRLA